MNLSNENVIHIQKDGIEYLQFRRLLEYKDRINHAYSLGVDRNYRTAEVNKKELEATKYQKALKDYEDLCRAIGSDKNNLVKTNQEHTSEVKVVTEKINEQAPDFNLEKYNHTDGLITAQNDILLATTNADCILMLFYDPAKNVIANTHSGWRGTMQRIATKTVEKLIKQMGCNPEDIICCICPSIRQCHFEVGEEVKEQFVKEFKELKSIENWIKKGTSNEKWNIDTVWINKEILKNQGLKEENIIDSKLCSMCHCDIIHSYRAEKEKYGLNVAVIEIKSKSMGTDIIE